jgi:magnesium-transporting ATPase (P-type)
MPEEVTTQKTPQSGRGRRHGLPHLEELSASVVSRWSAVEALSNLSTGSRGLTQREANRRLKTFGRNELAQYGRRNPLAMFAGNFVHLLALLLWIAAFLAFVGGLPELGWAILAVILINGVFSFAQEYRAGQLLEALQRQVLASAAVRRAGTLHTVGAVMLVPGDIVQLSEGDRVPADCRLLISAGLEADESALTGESMPVIKTPDAAVRGDSVDAYPNLLFAGTLIVHGDGEAVVWATGEHTQFGTISQLTASLEQAAGPLRAEIEGVARVTAVVAIATGLLIWAISTVVLDRTFNEGFIFAIGVIVALVPEGLLPTLSLSLALGVQRMARRNVLVRRLSAIEALGATQVICMDKTGTLTENRMVVERVWTPSGEFEVALSDTGQASLLPLDGGGSTEHVLSVLGAGILASNAVIEPDRADRQVSHGDPTEVAIVRAATALGAVRGGKRVAELPFDSYLRLMSSVDSLDGQLVLSTKGAPDSVIARCVSMISGEEFADNTRRLVLAKADAYAAAGLRVLAVARRAIDAVGERGDLEKDLELLGLVAMIDPVRPHAAQTVAQCHAAGIRVIVVTGDHPGTAAEIARRASIAAGREPRVITGQELDALTPAALRAALQQDLVFARTTPIQKLAVVSALQEMGNVVAVIGDGVNDAPSLRRADVGVAMGKSGTDVAREAADIILLDDNFATIVDAIEEGRAIFANIRNFVTYVFTSNVAELAPFAAFVLAGIPLPLKIIQVLAVDLGTDLVPALALGAEPPVAGTLEERPRPRGEPLLDRRVFLRTFLLLGPIEAALGLAGFFFVYWVDGWRPGAALVSSGQTYTLATTMCFMAIVAGQIGNVIACRSYSTSLLKMPIARNRFLLPALAVEIAAVLLLVYTPTLQDAFDFTGPGLQDWLFVILILPLLPLADEVRKLMLRRRGSSR